MTQLLDSEGEAIPTRSGVALFEADLCDFNDGKGPSLAISVPFYFKTDGGVYDSDGVVHAPLQAILEEYLTNIIPKDGADAAPQFVAWLRDYADRLEKTYKSAKGISDDRSA